MQMFTVADMQITCSMLMSSRRMLRNEQKGMKFETRTLDNIVCE
jgi:hypothetical protein